MIPAVKNISDKERLNWLRLIRSENVGPKTFQSLFKLYGSVEAAIEAVPQLSVRGGKKKPTAILSAAKAKKEIEQAEAFGARIIAACEPEYSELLRHIKDYPPVITVFGQASLLNKKAVAIIGARNASANGCRFAQNIATGLGKEGLITVSGLARGIDTHVHQGSLENGTIAVVAGGINYIYPPENKELFYRIAENGVVVTEMSFDTAPKAQNFPRRNRIISGVSLGTVVVEAARRSGSLITARMALEQNREVFAVPGSPLDPRAEGTNHLIRQGAHLIDSAKDVASVLNQLDYQSQKGLFENASDSFKAALNPPVQSDCDKARPIVLEKLGLVPTLVDEIITQTNIAPAIVMTILLELELAGKLERHYGNKVSLVYTFEEQEKIA